MEIYLTKQLNNTFKASFDSDYEKIKKIKVGEERRFDMVKPRNIAFHRKFFALIKMVYENQEVYNNQDYFRKELTKAAGFYDEYTNHKGVKCYEAKSISFAKMTQEEFDDLYSKFIDKVVEIFSYDRQDIIDNLEDFM